jgi:transcription elongation factor Elf1
MFCFDKTEFVQGDPTEITDTTLIHIQVLNWTVTPSNNNAERTVPHKATLYCPKCTHESRVDGDWIVQVHPTSRDYECPDCGQTIESRCQLQSTHELSSAGL